MMSTDPQTTECLSDQRCGFISIVGRPNVGKSTLLNRLIGAKVSITSRKPQTTRHRITGLLTEDNTQYVFIDTPGYQRQAKQALARVMNKTVTTALHDVDVVLWVVEGLHLQETDEHILSALLPAKIPVIVVINKHDLVKDRGVFAEWLLKLQQKGVFHALVPVSAHTGWQRTELLRTIRACLPMQPYIFPEDDLTDCNERFLAAELVREKVFRLLGDELPYVSTVVIDQFKTEPHIRRIAATIMVDKDSHKGIVIGKKGERLKRIASEARTSMESLFGSKVFLEVWVKVKSGWADNEVALRSLGY